MNYCGLVDGINVLHMRLGLHAPMHDHKYLTQVAWKPIGKFDLQSPCPDHPLAHSQARPAAAQLECLKVCLP